MTAQRIRLGGARARVRTEIKRGTQIAAALGLLMAFGPPALLLVNMQIFSFVLPTGSLQTLIALLLCAGIVKVTYVALFHVRDLLRLSISNRVARRIAPSALAAIATRPGIEPAHAAAQVLRDIEEVRRAIVGPLCDFALNAMLIPMILIMLGIFHWVFLLFGSTMALLALILALLARAAIRDTLAESNGALVRGSVMVADAVRNAEAVAAMGLLPSIVRRWAGMLTHSAIQLRSAQAMARLIGAITVTLYGATNTGAMLVGAAALLSGANIGLGLMVGAMFASQLMSPMGQLGNVLEDAAVARAAWLRIDRLMLEADAAPAAESRAWPCPEGRLSVERLTYVHPGASRPLFREVSFVVEPGEIVALAGPPGSGKTTMLRLLLGIERPIGGSVFLDGHATAQWDREDFARHVGFLPQDPALPCGTVAEAIARLAPQPDMRVVMEAARLVGAERMIAQLPHGYATPLGAGFQPSMGQRQRIALARAVHGGPKLVILDEPAAYLDAEGEAAVGVLLDTLAARGVAVIFTSHREVLLRRADRVLNLRGIVPELPAPPTRRQIAGPRIAAGAPA